jgi:hypothetical protein
MKHIMKYVYRVILHSQTTLFFKNDHFKKIHLNFNAPSINRTEFDLKMLIQDEPNKSGLCTPYSILKFTNTLGRPTKVG